MKKNILYLIGIGVILILGSLINYLFVPAWNIRSAGLWFFFIIMSFFSTYLFAIIETILRKKNKEKNYIATCLLGMLFAILIITFITCSITGKAIFHSSEYQQMVSFIEGNFKEDIPELTDMTTLSIVDVSTARNLGDRTIGTLKNSTWYDVDDEYNLIKYKDGYYRISALNYGGLFKYNKAKYNGIPGYVLVNVSTQKAQYIELDEPIKYSPSAHFSNKLKRHLRSIYPSYMFGTSFFEIDEDGIPYYITSVKTPTIGVFGGIKEESFILTNASTGESIEYKIADLPEWVDHAYDLEYLMKIIDDNQKYVGGFWNSLTSKTGINKTSYAYRDTGDNKNGSSYDGYNTAITKNGEIVFYTGVTPSNGAESNIGFILANPRTGTITYYDCAGAEESSAQNSAEGLVQNLGYYATFPTIINVDGEETYFMLLKDKAGLVQRYSLCNIKDYTKVVQAEDLETTIKLYKTKLGISLDKKSEENLHYKEGKIENLYQAEIDGCTYYYFTFNGSSDLYISSIKNSNKQVLMKVGTEVSISYISSYEEDGVFIVKKIQF